MKCPIIGRGKKRHILSDYGTLRRNSNMSLNRAKPCWVVLGRKMGARDGREKAGVKEETRVSESERMRERRWEHIEREKI
jgi:hypothetical protein